MNYKKNPFVANDGVFSAGMVRLSRCVWDLENAKPEFRKVLLAGHSHPSFHNLQIEMLNLDYLLRTLPIDRDEEGRPLHPTDIARGRGI